MAKKVIKTEEVVDEVVVGGEAEEQKPSVLDELYALREKMTYFGVDSIGKLDVMIGQELSALKK